MSGIKEAQYWDSCIFISWLDKNHSEHVKVSPLVDDFNNGTIIVASSNLIYTELLDLAKQGKNKVALTNMMASENFDLIETNSAIMEKAGEFRSYAEKQKPKLKTPDAIHLATAAIQKIKIFYTFDEKLLKWDKKIPGSPSLRIKAPGSVDNSILI